ncbi:MAG TPA: CvpA family protein [Nitrolancea sp.]|nr:CvpA family protein [Nitrolancea sp.]
MHNLNWVDGVLVLIVLVSALSGIRRGFLRGAIDLVAIVVSLIVASYSYHRAADLISSKIHMSDVVANVIGFIAVMLVVQIVFAIFVIAPLTPIITTARRIPISKELDALLGVIPGAIKGLALATALVLVLVLTSFGSGMDQPLGQSTVATYLLSGANQTLQRADGHVGINLADFMFVVEPSSKTGMTLPFTVTSGLRESPSDEQKMLQELNDSRAAHGLAPLKDDPQLRAVAAAHSSEMLQLGYFSHTSPLHGTPTDRAQAAGIPFTALGENIAYAPTVDVAERGLMRSPGHRANILSTEFTRVGIGVVVTPFGTRMFTQEFAGP